MDAKENLQSRLVQEELGRETTNPGTQNAGVGSERRHKVPEMSATGTTLSTTPPLRSSSVSTAKSQQHP